MNDSSIAAGVTLRRPHAIPWLVIAGAVLAHLVLLLFDFMDPDAFLRADRATLRFYKVESVLDTTSFADFLHYISTHGLVGDYILHAGLFGLGGRFLTIIAQVGLLLLSAAATFRLCEALGLSRRACTVGMSLFLLLPHSVAFPHLLSSEAIHVPLLVVSTWLTVLACRRGSSRLLVVAGIVLAVATLVRPVTLAWPGAVGVALAILWKPSRGVYFAAAAFVPILLWMTFMGRMTGDFGIGESNSSLTRNLYQRVRFISQTLPEQEREQVQATYLNQVERGRLSVAQYLSFGVEYPLPFVAHLGRDSFVFFVKSGIEKVTIDYLGGGEGFAGLKGDERGGWRSRLQRDGVLSAAAYLWDRLGFVLVVSALGGVLMIFWLFAALFGGVLLLGRLRRLSPPEGLAATLIILLPIYIFGVSQVVDVMQSRLRAPAEFALIVLSVYGGAFYWQHTGAGQFEKVASRLMRFWPVQRPVA